MLPQSSDWTCRVTDYIHIHRDVYIFSVSQHSLSTSARPYNDEGASHDVPKDQIINSPNSLNLILFICI